MGFLPLTFLCLAITATSSAKLLDYEDLTVIIICQDNSVSKEKCERLESNVRKQTDDGTPVLLTHRDVVHDGDWTILPVLRILVKTLGHIPPWLIFCTEDTSLQVDMLRQVLSLHNADEEVFLGRALTDKEPTIIHHFSSKTDFQYPLFAAGFAISRQLLKTLGVGLQNETMLRDLDFSIDASYELSLFISDASDCSFSNSERFCIYPAAGCATYVSIREKIDRLIPLNSIFFAVKTCKKFHEDRVPAVQETWGHIVSSTNIAFYSDYYDISIPTVALNVTNTPSGHCSKTRGIIREMRSKFKETPSLLWAVISDDDTILSVRRVQELVSVYNASQPIAIGERYGYKLFNEGGYNYLTGGGGVIMSRAAILKFHSKACQCPAPATPDDMFLFGVCLKRLGITSIHTSLIHQARPDDYTTDYLSIGRPVSFHKHWMVEPRTIYKTWFHEYDDLIHKGPEHTEF